LKVELIIFILSISLVFGGLFGYGLWRMFDQMDKLFQYQDKKTTKKPPKEPFKDDLRHR